MATGYTRKDPVKMAWDSNVKERRAALTEFLFQVKKKAEDQLLAELDEDWQTNLSDGTIARIPVSEEDVARALNIALRAEMERRDLGL